MKSRLVFDLNSGIFKVGLKGPSATNQEGLRTAILLFLVIRSIAYCRINSFLQLSSCTPVQSNIVLLK